MHSLPNPQISAYYEQNMFAIPKETSISWLPKFTFVSYICSRISRFVIDSQVDCLKTRQDQDFINEYLEKGKQVRYF